MGISIEEQRNRIRSKNRSDNSNLSFERVGNIIDASELYAERLRENATPQELRMRDFLDRHNIHYKFQHPFFVDNHFYILDFYLPFYKVCLEIDGLQHYTKDGKRSDKIRDNELLGRSIITIRIKNSMFNDFNKIYKMLERNGLFGNKQITEIRKPKKKHRLNRRQRLKLRKKWQDGKQ